MSDKKYREDHPDLVREINEYAGKKDKETFRNPAQIFIRPRSSQPVEHGALLEFKALKEFNGYITDCTFPYWMSGQYSEWSVDEQMAQFLTGIVAMLRPQVMLETGTNRGRGTRAILDGLASVGGDLVSNPDAHLWTVDMQDYGLKTEGALEEWQLERVTQVVGRLPEAFEEEPLSTIKDIDFAFIDAGHTAKELERDINFVDAHRAEECWVVVHDTRSYFWDEISEYMRNYTKYPVISFRSMNGTDVIWMRDVKDHPI